MPGERWKQCSACGIITDLDETDCPQRGLNDNHELQIVELTEEALYDLLAEHRVFTKHHARLP